MFTYTAVVEVSKWVKTVPLNSLNTNMFLLVICSTLNFSQSFSEIHLTVLLLPKCSVQA